MKMVELLLTMSALASQSNFTERGFRLKDVRFVFELFANWLDSLVPAEEVKVHNTQVMRFMRDLSRHGFAKATVKGGQTRFQLSRMGLLELLQRLNDRSTGGFTGFHFTYYFLRTYGTRIQQMIQAEGSGYAQSLQMELKVLLDHKRFLQHRLEKLDHEIARLKVRIKETDETVALGEQLKRQGENPEAIVELLAKKFPYALQAQKPMTALMAEISPDQRLWELTEGNRQRTKLMWKAVLDELTAQKQILNQFL